MEVHKLQVIGEIGGLVFNIFFIHLMVKYFNVFNNMEKLILGLFVSLTFFIEIYLLSSWNGHRFNDSTSILKIDQNHL